MPTGIDLLYVVFKSNGWVKRSATKIHTYSVCIFLSFIIIIIYYFLKSLKFNRETTCAHLELSHARC